MTNLRLIGIAMFVYGAVMFALLFTPWAQWVVNHSIASVVSATDRRPNNGVGTVDRPVSIAGDVVMMFSGLWIGIVFPRALKKFKAGYQQGPSR